MRDPLVKPARVCAALLAVLAVSCGGGGGGGGGYSPPPSPPSAVTANAAVSAASVPEGQPFTLNAGGSSTTNGQPLTYAWTQVSGPAVTIASPNSAQLNLSAAEVTADTAAQFRVTVTAGADTAQATANVTFANIAQTPTFNTGSTLIATVTTSVTPRVIFGSSGYGIAGVADGSDPLTFLDFTLPNNTLQVTASQLPSLAQSAKLAQVSLLPGSNPNGVSPPTLAVMEESGNRFRLFGRNFAANIYTISDFTMTAPCGVSDATVLSGTGLMVGQRNGFSVIYGGGASPAVVNTFTGGGPACVLLAPRQPIDGTGIFTFPGSSPGFYDLITVNTDTNTVTVYQANGPGGGATYQQVAQVPVQLNSATPLTFAGWTPIGGLSSAAMALIFTDGQFNGQHRLVIMGLAQNRTLVQRTYTVTGGAPTNVFTDGLDGDSFYPEVVVTSPASPQAVVFEPTTSQIFGIGPLGSPSYLEIGLGATAAIPKNYGMVSSSGPLNAITFAYPGKKQMRVIGVP